MRQNRVMAVPVDRSDAFKPIRPTFTPPKDLGVLQPTPKDNRPAPSLVQRASAEGNDKIATLIASSQKAAKEQAKLIESAKTPRSKSRKVSDISAAVSNPASNSVPLFRPEDVCDDRTFIVRTRSGDMHSEEMKRLFYANGGDHFLKGGLTYAQAFDMLRKEKMRNISAK